MGAAQSSFGGSRSFLEGVRQGRTEAVDAALRCKPDLLHRVTLSHRDSALHLAACAGHSEVLALLLAQACHLGGGLEQQHTPCGDGPTSRFGRFKQVIQELVNAQNNRHQTPLMLAAAGGHEHCVELLLQAVRGISRGCW